MIHHKHVSYISIFQVWMVKYAQGRTIEAQNFV